MFSNQLIAKFLRSAGIFSLILTSGLGLLAGIGTACVAIDPTSFSPNMAKLEPYQAMYILFTLAGIVLGLAGIAAAIQLVQARRQAHRNALIVLIISSAIGRIHIYLSRMLRGSSMPYDMIFWVTLATLVLFLIFLLPGIRQLVDFSKGTPKDTMPAGGSAAIILGIITLTIQFTMAPSHTWAGSNHAEAFLLITSLAGIITILIGLGLLYLEHLRSFGSSVKMGSIEFFNGK